jgi:hypothetical protein
MKRFIASIFTALVLLLQTGAAYAQTFWNVQMSSPASPTTSKTFNLQFTTLSTDESNQISVEAFQNDISLGSQTVTAGGSGSFATTVAADGNFTYYLKAKNLTTNETKNTTPVAVVVDSTAPTLTGGQSGATVTRNGNNYTLQFTVPSGDATKVQIYAATQPQVSTDTAQLLATLDVKSGQVVAYNFAAPDATTRYFALRYLDGAGNTSPLTAVGSAPAAGATPGAAAGATGGQVAADSKKAGEVDSEAATDTNKPTATSESSNTEWWVVGLLVLLVGGALYVYYANGKIEEEEPQVTKAPKKKASKK